MEALREAPALVTMLGACPVLAAAKFLAPVRPGSALTIVLRPAGAGSVGFEVRRVGDAVVVASGRLVNARAAAPADRA